MSFGYNEADTRAKLIDPDTRTSEKLLDLIEAKGREIAEALAVLRGSTKHAHRGH